MVNNAMFRSAKQIRAEVNRNNREVGEGEGGGINVQGQERTFSSIIQRYMQ